jgi:hypothetical protein
MKKTAVEWLQEQLKDVKYNPLEKNGYPNALERLYQKAKDMEMTQITEAFDDGFENHYDADLYFNKKFKPGYKNEN